MGRALALIAVLAACGDDDVPPPADAAAPRVARADPGLAFEGHARLVVVLEGEAGASFAGATVRAAAGSPFEVGAQRCSGERCAAVVRVGDMIPNDGRAVPALIDARNQYLEVVAPAGEVHRAVVSVLPLDAIAQADDEISIRGLRFASSVSLEAAATLSAADQPMRLVVFGEVRLAGTIDAGATSTMGRGGGGAGGMPGAAGEGAGAGRGGDPGGGAGHAEAGQDGARGTAGPPYGDPSAPCGADFSRMDCGGSGGGGGDGAGGGGGGAVIVIGLGPFGLGAGIRATGGDGTNGGGGGSGGVVLLAGSIDGAATIDVAGGHGAGGGGDGAAGRIRVDGTALDGAWLGPSIDLEGLALVTGEPVITVRGHAPEGPVAILETRSGDAYDGTAGPDGTFAIEVGLLDGLNRFTVIAYTPMGEVRSMAGTSIELLDSQAAMPTPLGGTVDIAYVP